MRRELHLSTVSAIALWLLAAGPARAVWIDLGEFNTSLGSMFEGVEAGPRSHAVATGDVNGDGFDDLIVGNGGAGPNFEGEVSIVFGGASLPLKTMPGDLDGQNGFRIRPDIRQYRGYFGTRVTSGDLNGDGRDEVIIGASDFEPGGIELAGQVFVLFGRESFPAVVDFATGVADGERGFIIDGVDEKDRTGDTIAAIDLNGDGRDELITNKHDVRLAPDAYYVLYGSQEYASRFPVTDIAGERGFTILGVMDPERSNTVGDASPGGDVNGDGFNDLILASGIDVYDPMAPEGHVIFGAASHPSVIDLEQLDGVNGFTMMGANNVLSSATQVVSAGDVDGDGFDDILFQNHASEYGYNGAIFVIYGATSFPPSWELAEAPSGAVTVIIAEANPGRELYWRYRRPR